MLTAFVSDNVLLGAAAGAGKGKKRVVGSAAALGCSLRSFMNTSSFNDGVDIEAADFPSYTPAEGLLLFGQKVSGQSSKTLWRCPRLITNAAGDTGEASREANP